MDKQDLKRLEFALKKGDIVVMLTGGPANLLSDLQGGGAVSLFPCIPCR